MALRLTLKEKLIVAFKIYIFSTF